MAKPKKHSLSIENEIDFDMIGISCHHQDYRLAWGINDGLGLQLNKSEENFIPEVRRGRGTEHSFYEYYSEETMGEYFLIKNRSGNKYLVPEQPNMDYFLFVRETMPIEPTEWTRKLTGLQNVLAAYAFDPEVIDSVKNIIL
jgi:hypothetical protein